MIKTRINDRWDILLPDHRASQWAEEWEKKRLDSIYETTKKDDVIYYVGAEQGDMCALIQTWGSKLVLIEPGHEVWGNIKAIWDANKLEYPLASFEAFGSNDTTPDVKWGVRMIDGDINDKHDFKNLCEADGTIPKVKIDDIAKHVLPPDMITIDVEGAEWEVLKGAEETLIKYKPRIYLSLHPEFMFNIYGEYGSSCRNWIKNLGYKETLLDYEHEVHLLYEKIINER